MSILNQIRDRNILLLPFLVIVLNACSYNSFNSFTPEQQDNLLNGELLLGERAYNLVLPESQFLQLSNEMREFSKQITPKKKTREGRVEAILHALFNSPSINFKYGVGNTFTASEAFQKKTGNCLSFSTLFIALAREAGLTAKFNEVDIPTSWGEQDDNTFILYKHINVSIKKGPYSKAIVDVTQGIYKTRYPQSTISDRAAEAQYYNNIAVEYMAKNDTYQSFRHLKKAISLSPKNSSLWSNLGTLYRRENLNKEAGLAFEYALKNDPKNLAAISSLQRLYQNTGKQEKALKMKKKAERIRFKNPFYRYRKALDAFRDSNFELSEKHIKAAIKSLTGDHRFHLILSANQYMLGQPKKGEASMARAIKLADNSEIKIRYGQKLKLLKSIH